MVDGEGRSHLREVVWDPNQAGEGEQEGEALGSRILIAIRLECCIVS